MVARQVEMGLDHASVSTLFQCLQVCPLSQQQSDGAEHDALARTGLTGDDRESWIQVDIQDVYQCEVLDIEMLQHNSLSC